MLWSNFPAWSKYSEFPLTSCCKTTSEAFFSYMQEAIAKADSLTSSTISWWKDLQMFAEQLIFNYYYYFSLFFRQLFFFFFLRIFNMSRHVAFIFGMRYRLDFALWKATPLDRSLFFLRSYFPWSQKPCYRLNSETVRDS